MALRKQYHIPLNESLAVAQAVPFVNGIDNGEVTITQGNGQVTLTYNDVAAICGMIFPVASYNCDGERIPNFATLTEQEREYMHSLYPESKGEPALINSDGLLR